MEKLNENIKKTVRSWLNITPANPYSIQINEVMDFELTAIRNLSLIHICARRLFIKKG